MRNVNFVGDGTSIMRGAFATTTWLAESLRGITLDPSVSVTVHNLGMDGWTTDALIARASTTVDPLLVAGANNIYVGHELSNDLQLGGAAADQAFGRMAALCAARRAAGWRVIVATMLSRGDVGGNARYAPADLETQRQTVNALIRANWPMFADALADVGGDSSPLGYTGACTDARYFNLDRTHPVDMGHVALGALFRPVILSLVGS